MHLPPTAIDGDGMVVAVTFVNGRVHLRTKFVRTAHRKEEEKAHKFLYRGGMGTHPNGALKDSLTLLVNALQLKWPQLIYRNPSNTNVFYWGGKARTAHNKICCASLSSTCCRSTVQCCSSDCMWCMYLHGLWSACQLCLVTIL